MNIRRKSGYTVTELMMVTVIVGIMASVAPTLLIQLNNFYLMTTARNDIQRDARNSLDTINRFLRQAIDGTIVISTPSGQGPYSRISFKHIDGRTMMFYQNGNKLIQNINGNDTVMSQNLVYIAFTFPQTDDPTIVSVAMTMGKSIQRGRRKVLELSVEKVRVMN
ncbi:MAG: prepilin-type N-terminal cleavage/methylation domain-containing protein [Elusimicrobia bacterium]|nr:prepilin-type N-terminal cleavage/methylation domain-containing protein [Elusimicrobiota bacterium]